MKTPNRAIQRTTACPVPCLQSMRTLLLIRVVADLVLVRSMFRVIVAAVFCLAGTAAVLAGSPLLSQLQLGERLHVSYQSRGCFNDGGFEIDFRRTTSVTASSSGHTVRLSRREVAGLDRLFQFYRSRPHGGCTTQDNITISQFRGARKISNEHYVDGSCATNQMKDVTRLGEIETKLLLHGR